MPRRRRAALLDDLVGTFPCGCREPRRRPLGHPDRLHPPLARRRPRCMPLPPRPLGLGNRCLSTWPVSSPAGREAGVIAQGKTEEELEKRLGRPAAGWRPSDRDRQLRSAARGRIPLRDPDPAVVRARILGLSKAPELPTNAFVTATGNNLVLVGDMTRRAMMCRLDPQHERPELRRFATDPIEIGEGRPGVATLWRR